MRMRKRKGLNLKFKKDIHLYCEGDTEKYYFKMLKQKYGSSNVIVSRFPNSQSKVKIKTMGSSGLKLIKDIKSIKDKTKEIGAEDEVYAIFDKDNHNTEELIQCQKLAEKNNIKMIFSSECFEIWILMHFETVHPSASYNRKQLFNKLSGKKYFNCRQCKDKEIQKYEDIKGKKLLEFKNLLIDQVQFAKDNADKLYETNNDMINDKPYTNVGKYLPKIFKVNEF